MQRWHTAGELLNMHLAFVPVLSFSRYHLVLARSSFHSIEAFLLQPLTMHSVMPSYTSPPFISPSTMPLPPSPPPQRHPLDHHHPRPDNHPRKNRPPPHARPALSPAVRRPRGRTRCPRARTRCSALPFRARAVRIRCLAGIGHRLDARPVRAAAWLRCGGEGHVGALTPHNNQPIAVPTRDQETLLAL